jgi:uncharacterized protein
LASDLTPKISPSPVPSAVQSLFFGPKGLRSGWRVLFFILLTLVLSEPLRLIPPLLRFMRSLGVKGQMTAPQTLVGEAIGVAIVIVAAAIMRLLDKRTFADYGLPWKQAFGKRFWQGVPLGFGMLSVLLGSIWALHGFSLDGLAVRGATAAKFGLVWAIAFVLVGIYEDFLFRGYLQSALGDGIGFWPAAIVLALVFGGLHLGNSGEAIFGAVMAASFGLVSAFSLWRTGNLWLSIGMHMSWDWGETYFYGVPDSGLMGTRHLLNASFHGAKWLTGGTVGPEGSWLVFPVLALWALAIHFLFPSKRAASA